MLSPNFTSFEKKENKLIKQGHEFELLDEKALKDEVLYTEVDK